MIVTNITVCSHGWHTLPGTRRPRLMALAFLRLANSWDCSSSTSRSSRSSTSTSSTSRSSRSSSSTSRAASRVNVPMWFQLTSKHVFKHSFKATPSVPLIQHLDISMQQQQLYHLRFCHLLTACLLCRTARRWWLVSRVARCAASSRYQDTQQR